MARKAVVALVLVSLALTAVPLTAQNQSPLNGIVDRWPQGCISCHSAAVMGQTLNVLMGNMSHPNITRGVTALPDGCAVCHRDGALAPLVHKTHYASGAAANAPVMPCLACHKMNPATGKPENKSAPKNW